MTKLPIGTVLLTKDGRQIGNAIIVAHIEELGCQYAIRSDYGNIAKCTAASIPHLFHIGPVDKTHKHYPKDMSLTVIDAERFSDALTRIAESVAVMDLPKAAKSIDEAAAILEQAKVKLFEL